MNPRITPDGAVELDYEPPAPMFESTLSAFRAISRDPWTNPSVSLRMEPDPLGGPNRIVSLMRNGRDGSTRMGAVLYPIREGAVVSLGQDGDSYRSFGIGWRALNGGEDVPPWRPHVWYVTVDKKRILEVPYHLALPDVPPVPSVPLWSRLRHWMTAKARSAADGAARRAGYVRGDEGGEW